jgi:hypothetical protein
MLAAKVYKLPKVISAVDVGKGECGHAFFNCSTHQFFSRKSSITETVIRFTIQIHPTKLK